MATALTTVAFAPLAIACCCFLVALYYMTRMLGHIKDSRRLISYVAAPVVVLAESSYTSEGVVYLRSFQRWFRRFSLWLLGWGMIALLLVGPRVP